MMLKGQSLLDYTNLFSSTEYEKNYKIILKLKRLTKKIKLKKYILCYLSHSKVRRTLVSMENLKNPKYHIFSKKIRILSIIFIKCGNEDEKIFKEEELIMILKILGLIRNM